MTEYDFEKLNVYQEAMALAEKIYEITKGFPREEQFGVTSQIRRAVISVPLNIAEGKGRYHTKTFIQFLYQARGSLYEVMALIDLSARLKYIDAGLKGQLREEAESISKKINNLINSMK